MGYLGPRGSRKRPQYLGGLVLTRPTEHGIVASFWPRRRGKTTNRYQRSIQENLQTVTKALARQTTRETEPIRQALQEVNQHNEGFRGSAAIRLEDLMTQLMMGRLFAWRLPNGRTAYHINVVMDASRRLDWLEPLPGSILTRTNASWLPTTPCTPGAVCTLLPDTHIPGCCPPAAPHPNEV